MGNSQSNSINDRVNQIIADSPESSAKKESPVEIKFNSVPKQKFVNTETDAPPIVGKSKVLSATSPAPVAGLSSKVLSATSPAPLSRATPVASRTETALSATSSAVVPAGQLSATSPVSSEGPRASDAPSVFFPPQNRSLKPRSPRLRSPRSRSPRSRSPRSRSPRSPRSMNAPTSTPLPKKVITLSPEIFKTPAESPSTPSTPMNSLTEINKPKKGGYSYKNEVSDVNNPYTGGDGHKNVISLDNSIFETSELSGGEEEQKKSSDFNPEQFFKDMQTGGLREPRNKEYKSKSKIDRYLSSETDEGFDFAEATEGLDIDSNEDTEDIKNKVKALRAMVSRSKAKKGSKKGSKKVKRAAQTESESTGGATENSASEYLNSTSSISTSDVRLISMNKMRK